MAQSVEPKFPDVRLGWAVWVRCPKRCVLTMPFALIALVLITIAFLCSLADKYALAKSQDMARPGWFDPADAHQMIQPNVGSKGEGESGWATQQGQQPGYQQQPTAYQQPAPQRKQQSVSPSDDPGIYEPQTQQYNGQAAPRYEASGQPPSYAGSGYGGGGQPR